MKNRLARQRQPAQPWWKEITGIFADDPIFEQAMKLARSYRRSLRSGTGKRHRHKNGHTCWCPP